MAGEGLLLQEGDVERVKEWPSENLCSQLYSAERLANVELPLASFT